MGSGSGSESTSSQKTTTQTITDSFNRSFNDVKNLSNVGNVNIGLGDSMTSELPFSTALGGLPSLGDSGVDSPDLKKYIAPAIAGVAVLAILIFAVSRK